MNKVFLHSFLHTRSLKLGVHSVYIALVNSVEPHLEVLVAFLGQSVLYGIAQLCTPLFKEQSSVCN